MLPHARYLTRAVLLATTAATALAASTAPALAAGQTLCIGGPAAPVISPDSNGQCPLTYKATTLASQSDLTALQSRVSTLESNNATLKSDVSALKNKVSALENKLSKVRYDATGVNGTPTLSVIGANLQLIDGSGDTDGSVNGLGNLFIGYNEQGIDTLQTGSHNLIVGSHHSFTSFGGLIAGQDNTVTGAASSVSGGVGNIASQTYSSVSGGSRNRASGVVSSVSGGSHNTVSGPSSSVSGGQENTASGWYSSILGGSRRMLDTVYGTYPAGP